MQKESVLAVKGKTPSFQWVSLNGSVTKTFMGAGFPASGINEKGLTVQAPVASASMPPIDGVYTAVEMTQWIQYHLDMSKDITEVISATVNGPQPVVPVATTVYFMHYLVCDSTTACAGFDFHSDRVVVYTAQKRFTRSFVDGSSQPVIEKENYLSVPAVANSYYDLSQKAHEECPAGDCAGLDDSLKRYIRIANTALDFNEKFDDLVPCALSAFPLVTQGHPLTLWNIVYESSPTGSKIYFKSPEKAVDAAQWVDLDGVDYSCKTPAKVWLIDLDAPGGERTAQALVFDQQIHKQLTDNVAAALTAESL